MSVTRRSFLSGIAATLAAAPFARLLEGEARATGTGTAHRLVVFFSPNGTIHHQRRPTGSGSSFSFAPGSILEPLAPIQDQLILIDGLDFHGATNHEGGMKAMLTGNGGASDPGGGASVDQFVASNLGLGNRFSSLALGVQTSPWGGSTQTRMSYSQAGAFVTPDDNPTSVFERLFGGTGTGAAEQARMQMRRERILGMAMDDVQRLHARLGTAEQRKLESHMDALTSLEASLHPTMSCSSPVPPARVANIQDHGVFDTVGQQQMDLLVASLACDMTRVATLQWSHTVAPQVLSFLGLTDAHHALSHAGDGDSHGVDGFRIAERFFASQFRYLVERLANTPDPLGGSLLDSTLVVWAKEMGDSRMHVCEDVPFVLAGNAGGRFTTGRYLRYNGEPHNQLLVSICQAMGLSTQTFGNPSYGSGALPGLV